MLNNYSISSSCRGGEIVLIKTGGLPGRQKMLHYNQWPFCKQHKFNWKPIDCAWNSPWFSSQVCHFCSAHCVFSWISGWRREAATRCPWRRSTALRWRWRRRTSRTRSSSSPASRQWWASSGYATSSVFLCQPKRLMHLHSVILRGLGGRGRTSQWLNWSPYEWAQRRQPVCFRRGGWVGGRCLMM